MEIPFSGATHVPLSQAPLIILRLTLKERRRRRVLLAPSNDGQLHGFDAGVFHGSIENRRLVGRFDAGTGSELFAHIPRPMLLHTRRMVTLEHAPGLDGPVTVDDVFLDRLTRSKGRAIVTASRPAEVSIELPDLGHGVFTYYLVRGLQGYADLNRDGIVSLQEIYEYLAQEVSKKSRAVGGNQHPMLKGELEGIIPLTKIGKRN